MHNVPMPILNVLLGYNILTTYSFPKYLILITNGIKNKDVIQPCKI